MRVVERGFLTPRLRRRRAALVKTQAQTARDLLFNLLVNTAAVRAEAFPVDRQKEARVLLREIADRVRKLRGMQSGVQP